MRTQSMWKRAGTGLLLVAMLATSAAIAPPAHADDDRGWLGVTTQTLTDELREGLDFNYTGDGALVNRVVVGSPAEKAGIRKGDVITAVNSKAIASSDALINAIAALKPGAYATVKLMRDGSFRTFNVKLGSRNEEYGDDGDMEWRSVPMPPGAPKAPKAPKAFYFRDGDGLGNLSMLHDLPMGDLMVRMNRGRLGVRVQDLNADLASYFGNVTKGALVLEVVDDTPASRAGIKAGDVITKVADQSVEDTDDLMSALRGREGKVSLGITRKGTARTIEAQLEEKPEPRVYRWKSGDGGGKRITIEGDDFDSDEMQRQMDELKKELDQLKKEIGGSTKKKQS